MLELAFASIGQLRQLLFEKKISQNELLDFFIRRFEVHDPELGSALEVFNKDWILQRSRFEGALHGIPGIIKNNICIKDVRTTCASKILGNFVSPFSATAIERLDAVGGISIGTANLDEFAMGSSTETSAFKRTRNPWDTTRVPGGSSGGSAVAVAAGLVPWSLGSETGGSVRHPAALCGIVGLKPTYGRISRYGLIAYGSSLDQIGIFTRTVSDCALLLEIIAGRDERDSTSLHDEVPKYTQSLPGTIKPGTKIGIIPEIIRAPGMDPEISTAIEEAIKTYEKLGAKIIPVSMPALKFSAATYFVISRAEAASNLARFDGVRYGYRNKQVSTLQQMYEETRHDGLGAEVKSRILIGNFTLSAGNVGEYYGAATHARNQIRADYERVFKDIDVLLMPTTPIPAFPFDTFADNKLEMDLQDYFTCSANLAGVPAIAIPCGMTTSHLPIGMQLIGPHLSEERILAIADAYERVTPWHTMHPKGY